MASNQTAAALAVPDMEGAVRGFFSLRRRPTLNGVAPDQRKVSTAHGRNCTCRRHAGSQVSV